MITTFREVPVRDDVTVSGTVAVSPNADFPFRVASGGIAGMEALHKFGRNPDIDTATDPEDIWDGGGLYTFPTAAVAMELVSSSTSDDLAGVGAQKVAVVGIDINWAEISEEVETDGTNAVALSNSYRRVWRAYVTQMGTDSSEANIGDITIRGSGGGTTYAVIKAAEAQTGMAIYTVPAGYTGYITDLFAAVSPKTTANVDLQLRFRDTSGTNPVSNVKLFFSASDAQDFVFNYYVPLPVPAKTDILVRAVETSANDANVTAGWNMYLVAD